MGFEPSPPPTSSLIRYSGITWRESANGDSCTIRYRVPKELASSPMQASKAPGIPKKWDRLFHNGVMYDLYCTDKETTSESDGVENVYTVTAVFTPRNIAFFNREIRTVDWRVGTTSTKVEVSVTGKPIGSLQSFNGSQWENVIDPNAELGADDLIATLDFAVRVPQTQLWNPVIVAQMMNTVNNGLVGIQNVTFPAGTLLFLNGEARAIGPSERDYEVFLYFMTGWKRLSSNLPAFVENTTTPWNGGNLIPIKYGTSPRYRIIKNPEDPSEVLERRPSGISVYQAKHESDFINLRF